MVWKFSPIQYDDVDFMIAYILAFVYSIRLPEC
jgi:hypothetical protein